MWGGKRIVARFFELLRDELAGFDGSSDFVLAFAIDGAGEWTIAALAGVVNVREGTHCGDPDCSVSCSAGTILQIATNQLRPTVALISGKIKVVGKKKMCQKKWKKLSSNC